MYESTSDVDMLWMTFKNDLLSATNQRVPSSTNYSRHHVSWLDHHLKKLLKKKKCWLVKLLKASHKDPKLDQVRVHPESLQKKCKRAFCKCKVEWKYLRNTIELELENSLCNSNPKPFWQCVKAKKQWQSSTKIQRFTCSCM